MAVIPKLSQARRKHFITLLPDKMQKNGPEQPQIWRVGGFLCFSFLQKGARRWIVCRDWEWRHKRDSFAGHRRFTAVPEVPKQQSRERYLMNKRVKFEAPDVSTFVFEETEAWIGAAEWISAPDESIAHALGYFWPALILLQDSFRLPDIKDRYFDPFTTLREPQTEKPAIALAAYLALTDWPAAKKRFESEKRNLPGRARSLEYYTSFLQKHPGRYIEYNGYKWNPGAAYADVYTDPLNFKIRLF